MTASPFLALIVTLTFAILSPGPSIIAASQTALSRGRGVALPYALGLAFGASLWCLFALLGLAVVFEVYPALFRAAKLLGSFYLLYVAWGLWRAARLPLPDAAQGPRRFFGGMMLSLSNPKPALFYSALILSLFPDPHGVARIATIYGVALSTELFWYSAVALGMSTKALRNRYFAAKFWIDRIAALALLTLAILLVVNL